MQGDGLEEEGSASHLGESVWSGAGPQVVC